MNYTSWKRKEPVPLTRQFVGRQIFHGFSYCAPGATKRQPVSSLSVQGLPASLCVAKHYQQHSQIFYKLRKISWGSRERNFFFSKSLTSRTIYVCSREWFIISKTNFFFLNSFIRECDFFTQTCMLLRKCYLCYRLLAL